MPSEPPQPLDESSALSSNLPAHSGRLKYRKIFKEWITKRVKLITMHFILYNCAPDQNSDTAISSLNRNCFGHTSRTTCI